MVASEPSHRIFYYHDFSSASDREGPWAQDSGQRAQSPEPGTPSFYPIAVSIRQLDRQLRALKTLGYRFITLSEAWDLRASLTVRHKANNPPSRTITLSTDDGFVSNYSLLFPLLKHHRIPCTLFLIGKCIDNKALAWNHKWLIISRFADPSNLRRHLQKQIEAFTLKPDKRLSVTFNSVRNKDKDILADLLWDLTMPLSQNEFLVRYKPFLTIDQIRKMVSAGMELGSHSNSHLFCHRCSYEELRADFSTSFDAIEALSRPRYRFLAYPYGHRPNPETEHRLKQDLNIKNLLGIGYATSDNRSNSVNWNRQPMEYSPLSNLKEFTLVPMLRSIKRAVFQ